MRPAVLATRATFPDIADRLREHFDVSDNPADTIWHPAELIARLRGKQGVMSTGSERIDASLLDACPQLKAVCNVGVGYNNVDVAACTARGVVVTNTPDVLTETTADFGFALMMATARRVAESERFVRRGALGFGMRVIYHNRSRLAPAFEAESRATWVDKTALLKDSDHLVLVLPYSANSHHAIGTAELAQMKPSATLTNIARGGSASRPSADAGEPRSVGAPKRMSPARTQSPLGEPDVFRISASTLTSLQTTWPPPS